MIIGGPAALLHGRPRFTEDVDVTLGVDTDQLDLVLKSCRALKLTPKPADPQRFAEQTKVLPARDPRSGLRVDFIFSSTLYEGQAIQRAVAVPLAGHPVRFASAEDLVIHKVLAGRAIDLEDARAVILRQGNRLDKAYIRKWLRSFNAVVEDGRDLLQVWGRVAKEATR